jgi:hypothetical protein
MSAEKYPPVRGLSRRQQGAITYFGKKFHPSEYKSFDFSPAFKAIYGETSAYDSDWDRLTSTPFNKDLIPKSRKYNFLEFVNKVTFLYFAKSADEKASMYILGVPLPHCRCLTSNKTSNLSATSMSHKLWDIYSSHFLDQQC